MYHLLLVTILLFFTAQPRSIHEFSIHVKFNDPLEENWERANQIDPPPAPSSLTAAAASTTQINLTWLDNSTDETAFYIERSPNGVDSWTQVGSTTADVATYTDSGLEDGLTYFYQVRAYRSGDGTYSLYSNTASATTIQADHQNPIANWTKPVGDGEVYTPSNPNGSVLLEIEATDNVQVDYVLFTRWDAVNERVVEISTDSTPPYQTTIDLRLLNYDWNEFDAYAYDTSGNESNRAYFWIYRNETAPCVNCGLANSPWPAFRQNIQRTGRSTLFTPTRPIINTFYSVDGSVSSAPVVGSDGTIYVGLGDGLTALSSTGSHLWTFPSGPVVKSPVVASSGTVYAATANGMLYAVNPNGTQKWAFNTASFLDNSPAVGPDGTIYLGTLDGNIYAVDPEGDLVWRYEAGGLISSSIALDGSGNVYFGGSGRIFALNFDGSPRWSLLTGAAVEASPALTLDGTMYIGSVNNTFYALTNNRSIKWSFTTGGPINSSAAIASNGTVYVGSSDDKLYAFNPNGTLRWAYPTGGDVDSSPAIDQDGTIIFGSNDGWIYALNPDGTLSWKVQIPGETLGPVIGPGGVIFANAGAALYSIVQDISVIPPTNLTSTAISHNRIDLTWKDNATDETNYRIERSLNGTSGWSQIGTAPTNSTTYSDTGLEEETTYYYRVRAYRLSDTSYSAYSNVTSATTPAIVIRRFYLPSITRGEPQSSD